MREAFGGFHDHDDCHHPPQRLPAHHHRAGLCALCDGYSLPRAVAAYTLRHSVITDLIRARLPILTVAQLSGTSVAMADIPARMPGLAVQITQAP